MEPNWYVFLSALGPSTDTKGLEKIRELVTEHLAVELEHVFPRAEQFDDLVVDERAVAADPSDEEVATARVVAERPLRTLLTAIKSSSGLLVGDAEKQLASEDRGRTGQILDRLASEGLVSTESVVICKGTGTQVARMPSEVLVSELEDKGVRCACGNRLTRERVERAVAVTDRAVELLDGSKWMTMLLVEELLRLGVPLDDILVEQTSGGDEMDCIANIAGGTVLFELKDKTFSLRDAYSFGAKIGIIRPDAAVIVTTEKVGNDAKDHFDRASSAGRRSRTVRDDNDRSNVAPIYIEGIDTLGYGLEELATQLSMDDAVRVLGEALPMASLDPVSLLTAWLSQTRS